MGAGFTGLWAAHQALDDDPGADVLVIDASGPGDGASGRNGGFCDASITHGIANGMARWPEEYPLLHRLGVDNLAGLLADLQRLRIDAAWEPTGELDVATEQWQLDDLREHAEMATGAGEDVTVLDRDEVRAEVDSPTFRGGVWRRSNVGLVDPGRLVAGLRAALLARGARIADHTPVNRLDRSPNGVTVSGPSLAVDAGRVMLATNAFPGLLAPLRRSVVPVYDHVLVTEPLDPGQRAAVGWANRQGLGDAANQFHYFRLTDDDRILWGGYDALYHYGGPVGPAVERNDATERMLASQLLECFPQLEGIRISHTWGGPIATTTRFAFTAGTRWDRRVAWAVGYTGLGVAASRFGARVGLDLLAGDEGERTRISMVRRAPVPWPPEPVRWAGITLTRRAIAKADRHEGRRGPWLRLLDRLGLGFDS
ncbi:MAG: FAD-binding oxidoreductase [Microthrixaceae bacterium]|nr:FAD-binding oxidoreductase [Microthrixaceae bacterium]